MKSESRHLLHTKFSKLDIGDRFQMVNSVMGAAISNGIRFEKLSNDATGINAKRLDTDEEVIIRIASMVEVIKSNSEK